ncbi:MAG: hypothetical protein RIR52_215 [Acidobacteriota bacterium]|jgi:hypothetical protein
MNQIHINRRSWSGRFAFIFVIALSSALLYLMISLLPVWLSYRQMREATTNIVRRGAVQKLDLLDIRAQIVEQARESRLPQDARIDVAREGMVVSAHITYSRTLYLPFYSWEWPLEIHVIDLGI